MALCRFESDTSSCPCVFSSINEHLFMPASPSRELDVSQAGGADCDLTEADRLYTIA